LFKSERALRAILVTLEFDLKTQFKIRIQQGRDKENRGLTLLDKLRLTSSP
jgi:hypothetical protein